MAVVANVARYHRRACPSKSHLPYMALDREARIDVNKLSAILRLANALDADHLQKVKDVRLLPEDEDWVLEVEGAGDLTMERLAVAGPRRLPDRGLRPQGHLPRDAGAPMAVTARAKPSRARRSPSCS